MGRSVSTPNNTVTTVYGTLRSGFECLACGNDFDEPGSKATTLDDGYTESSEPVCPHCGAGQDEFQRVDPQFEFEQLVESLQDMLPERFKSLTTCDEWIDREDHALLENRYCHIGISEYCGLIAVWIAAKDGPWYGDAGWEALRDNWLSQVRQSFRTEASKLFADPLIKQGTFSNGEAIFQPASGQQRGAMGLGYSSKEGWL